MVFRTTWILPGKVGKASQTRWHLNWDLKTSERNQRSLKGVQDVRGGVGCEETSAEAEAEIEEEGATWWDSGRENFSAFPCPLILLGLLCTVGPLFSFLFHSDVGWSPFP